MSTPQHVTKTRFAALLGVGKSYVSNLATQGRLVVNEQGLVDVEASKRLIAQTAGAPERGVLASLQFADARERKEHYLAEAARMDYEERCGHLLPAEAAQLRAHPRWLTRQFTTHLMLRSAPQERVSNHMAGPHPSRRPPATRACPTCVS